MATNHAVQTLLTEAGKFVAGHKGCWEHADWEMFLEDVKKVGLEVTDENKRNLGNILEAAKYFYGCLATAPAKKPAARKKAARS